MFFLRLSLLLWENMETGLVCVSSQCLAWETKVVLCAVAGNIPQYCSLCCERRNCATMPPRNIEQAPSTVDEELPEAVDRPPLIPPIVKRPPLQIVWRNVIWFIFLHCFAVYGLYLLPFCRPATWLWGRTQFIFLLYQNSMFYSVCFWNKLAIVC